MTNGKVLFAKSHKWIVKPPFATVDMNPKFDLITAQVASIRSIRFPQISDSSGLSAFKSLQKKVNWTILLGMYYESELRNGGLSAHYSICSSILKIHMYYMKAKPTFWPSIFHFLFTTKRFCTSKYNHHIPLCCTQWMKYATIESHDYKYMYSNINS